jgi:carbon-monoxide dehydrogenase large subunit
MGRFGVGQAVRRVEDLRFLTGQGQYAPNRRFAGELHGAFVRSPHAFAEIVAVDTRAAQAMPGVQQVYSGADWLARGFKPLASRSKLQNVDGSPLVAPPRFPLAHETVRHVGEPVVLVVARSRQQAIDACEAVVVDYRERQPVVDVAAAGAVGAPLVHNQNPGNVAFDWQVGDADKAAVSLAGAHHVVTCDLVNNRVVPTSMETRSAIAGPAGPDGEGYWFTGSIQNVFAYRALLADCLGLEVRHLRVYALDIGGGFGCKNQVQPEHAAILMAARDLGCPVRWTASRSEAFVADAHARGLTTTVELGLTDEFDFTALRVRTAADLGAYCSTNGPLIPTAATAAVLGGAYRLADVYMRVQGRFTNTPPTDAYRGAGRPEATYLLERTIDKAAAQLGVDPAELRRRNLVAPGEMPYITYLGRKLDCGNFPAVLDAGLKQADWSTREERREVAKSSGRLFGIGIGFYMESTLGVADEFANVSVTRDGLARITVGTQNAGMGHETSFRQLVSEVLDLPPDAISYIHADTGAMPQGGGHGGSRSMQIGGSAVHLAARQVLDKLKVQAGDLLEADFVDIEFSDGEFRVVGTDRMIPLARVLRALPADLSEDHIYQRENFTFPNGCHVCEVEVDPDTGHVDIMAYCVCDDFGRIVNPMIVRGQVLGGIAQGLGQAMLEHTVFDPDSGQILSASLMDYALPRADTFPLAKMQFYQEEPAISNPLGVKGCGEAGTIGALPAFVNAVVDALAPHGVTHLDMPLRPETVWRAIRVQPGAGNKGDNTLFQRSR